MFLLKGCFFLPADAKCLLIGGDLIVGFSQYYWRIFSLQYKAFVMIWHYKTKLTWLVNCEEACVVSFFTVPVKAALLLLKLLLQEASSKSNFYSHLRNVSLQVTERNVTICDYYTQREQEAVFSFFLCSLAPSATSPLRDTSVVLSLASFHTLLLLLNDWTPEFLFDLALLFWTAEFNRLV